MFIYSLRASTLKFIAVVIISIGLLITLVTIIPNAADSVYAASSDAKIVFDGIKTNEDRISFISQFGWTVNPEFLEAAEIVIPKEFDNVYKKYNEIQKLQGLNLEKYRNKKVTRFTYSVKEYPGYDGTVYLNLLVYKDKVIGGDICSADLNGFIHGFDPANKVQY